MTEDNIPTATPGRTVNLSDNGEVQSIAAAQLRSFVERIERLDEEKKAIADDIKDVYGEAKSNGYDTKALRRLVALRKMDRAEREERAAVLELYANALGMTGVFD
jgi:uncharacterized protein (UPF0335 family)